ncbi:Asp-tRNA(Asn)/Glu-tRNA(Gln) amidotransferase A subunit family amidase [Caballeronia udeis]|uniref:Asp-tRNA(Asn)/Glu-tRNA(Gln) amidotransferase A subunit family amidase n=1 Tax=Caballeronia udeis TaxID=1232866 RepID=A0ABW8MCP0_9BURK
MEGEIRRPDVSEIVGQIRRKERPRDSFVRQSLSSIDALDSQIRAWVCVAPRPNIIEAASAVDTTAPLAGVPIGVKDVLHVAGMPTAFGARLSARRAEEFDAACVGMLRGAGAVPIGKTVTAEFAYKHPGPTRNPHDLRRTPGGSSSGSAAAVAAGMVPVAIGTQTGGSIIRPAAFCGVTGFKPSFGAVPRDGMKVSCESLDVIGWYGTSVTDIGAIADVLLSDERVLQAPTRRPRVAVICGTSLHALDADAREVLVVAERALTDHGATCTQTAFPREFTMLAEAHRTIMEYEFARSLAPVVSVAHSGLSEELLTCVRRGLAISRSQYRGMKDLQSSLRDAWNMHFGDADLILTPSVPGEAPLGLATTGSAAFNVAWSVLGWPCLHIPFGRSSHGLPLGIQLVGKWNGDAELLGWGGWIESLGPDQGAAINSESRIAPA